MPFNRGNSEQALKASFMSQGMLSRSKSKQKPIISKTRSGNKPVLNSLNSL